MLDPNKREKMNLTVNQLKEMLVTACDKGFGDIPIDVVQTNSCVDDGCPVIGLRCVVDDIGGEKRRYVSIVES